MPIREPRCIVCGAPLDKGAPFKKDVRNSEVCSDRCYETYMHNEDQEEIDRNAKVYELALLYVKYHEAMFNNPKELVKLKGTYNQAYADLKAAVDGV